MTQFWFWLLGNPGNPNNVISDVVDDVKVYLQLAPCLLHFAVQKVDYVFLKTQVFRVCWISGSGEQRYASLQMK